MQSRRRFILLAGALALLAPGRGLAQTSPSRIIQRYADDSGSTVTACAVNLLTGQVLLEREPDRPRTPASVQKLLTSAVALATLGADFEFTTRLYRRGDHLLVVGDGDPTFGDPVLAEAGGGSIYETFDTWATGLRETGLDAVDNILLDDSILRGGRGPDWPRSQHQRWYCAPAAGLNFNDNCLDVLLQQRDGEVVLTVTPATRWMPITNAVQPGARDIWAVVFGPDDASATVRGQIHGRMTDPLSVAVNEPALLFGRVLAERLAQAGIDVTGQVMRAPDGAAEPRLLAEHRTGLLVAMTQANKRSLNMMAECMLLRSAAEMRGVGGFDNAPAVAAEVLTGQYGLDREAFVVADGSGMSRGNQVSARAIVQLLDRLARGDQALGFLQTLSVAGIDGTLDDRLTDHPGRVIGKTGTLSGVVTLAGYVLNRERRPTIAFAVLCSNVRTGHALARRMQDDVLRAWIEQLDAEAPPPAER